MSICYSEVKSDAGLSRVPYEKWNAVNNYLEHYANMLFLDFIANTSEDGKEAAQARHELPIADKKMKFWTHHPNYDHAAVLRGVEKLKKDWKKK